MIPSESPDSTSDDGQTTTAVNWDDSTLSTVYANEVNVGASREEIALVFGTSLG